MAQKKNKHDFEVPIKADSEILPENFIGVAVKADEDGSCYHSGLVIGVDGEHKLFHYTGIRIELSPIVKGKMYFFKELEILDSKEAEAFLAHCEIIKEKANPKYDFVFDGSFYNSNGEYFSKTDLGERYTCVGFCINTITGFLVEADKYFELDDWSTDTKAIESFEKYLENNPDVDPKKVKPHFKRISPKEYYTSAYLTDLPIRKKAIDEIIAGVQAAIKTKIAELKN